MQRSVAAKYVPRPAASFVQHTHDQRMRLGLRSTMSFQPARSSSTVLRATRNGLTAGETRILGARRSGNGRLRSAVRFEWVDLGRSETGLRSSLSPAPWRG